MKCGLIVSANLEYLSPWGNGLGCECGKSANFMASRCESNGCGCSVCYQMHMLDQNLAFLLSISVDKNLK